MAFDPLIVEARIALHQIGFQEYPAIAGDVLEADLDGPAIRRMAALIQPTGFEVDELLPRFIAEAELSCITPATACTRLAVERAKRILSGTEDPLPQLAAFERWFLDADCPIEFRELALIQEDAFAMEYMGSTEDHIRAWAIERLEAFLKANS